MINGLVLFDYDGTLVDERAGIFKPTNASITAIEALQAKGYACVLATGRAIPYAPINGNGITFDGLITSNGASVIMHEEKVFHKSLLDNKLTDIINYCDSVGSNYILEGDDYCFVKDLNEKMFTNFLHEFKISLDRFKAFSEFDSKIHEINKVSVVAANMEQVELIGKRFASEYAICISRDSTIFDLSQLGLNKGTGVKKLIDKFNIPYDQTYAFGDGINDIELLENVNCGIAMNPHHESLDKVADFFTESVVNEGIQKALKKLEVIK